MRFQDWQSRMEQFLQAQKAAAFEWGLWDCALLAAAHIDNLTGSSHYADHAGLYDSEESAAAYLKSLGVADIAGLATSILGAPLNNVRFAQRGDVVTLDTKQGPGLGIVSLCGTKIIALDPSMVGFTRMNRDLATAVWRV